MSIANTSSDLLAPANQPDSTELVNQNPPAPTQAQVIHSRLKKIEQVYKDDKSKFRVNYNAYHKLALEMEAATASTAEGNGIKRMFLILEGSEEDLNDEDEEVLKLLLSRVKVREEEKEESMKVKASIITSATVSVAAFSAIWVAISAANGSLSTSTITPTPASLAVGGGVAVREILKQLRNAARRGFVKKHQHAEIIAHDSEEQVYFAVLHLLLASISL